MKKDINKVCTQLKQNKGRVLAETLATMLLLVLLGVGCFSLAVSAVGTYKRLYNKKAGADELRVASFFITNKIRQNDISGGLEIKPDPMGGKDALVIHEDINGTTYTTWIFCYEGQLYEALVLKDEMPEVDLSQPVARIDFFDISYSQETKGINTKVGINGYETYDSFIKLRSN